MNDPMQQEAAEPAPPKILAHTLKPNAFSSERTFRLEPDAISWSDARTSGRVPYADIKRAHIYSMPPYLGQTIRRTILRGNFPGKLRIQATHYRGIGQTEDRSESYFPFAEEMLARIQAANPDLAIRVGQAWPLYIFWVVMLVFFILMLPLMAAILYETGDFSIVFPLAIVGFFVPMCWRLVRRGRPRRSDASALRGLDLGAPTNTGS